MAGPRNKAGGGRTQEPRDLYAFINKLSPQNEEQQAAKSLAIRTASDFGELYPELFAKASTTIPTPLLIVVVCWLVISHSITLTAATLGFVNVPQAPVEAIIALSIFFVATEILHGLQGRKALRPAHPGSLPLPSACFTASGLPEL